MVDTAVNYTDFLEQELVQDKLAQASLAKRGRVVRSMAELRYKASQRLNILAFRSKASNIVGTGCRSDLHAAHRDTTKACRQCQQLMGKTSKQTRQTPEAYCADTLSAVRYADSALQCDEHCHARFTHLLKARHAALPWTVICRLWRVSLPACLETTGQLTCSALWACLKVCSQECC